MVNTDQTFYQTNEYVSKQVCMHEYNYFTIKMHSWTIAAFIPLEPMIQIIFTYIPMYLCLKELPSNSIQNKALLSTNEMSKP